ncbi:SH3 domain-containing protein [Streptomyces tricolor]|uniref:SH3 domain-containing protein n=1 Tax=Streptomyces tricolor TaxID=68277 RepID=UPI003D746DD8
MSKWLRSVAVAAGAAGLIAVPFATAVPAAAASGPASTPATALSCSHAYSNKSSGTARLIGNGVNVRTGPHTTCASTGQLNYGDGVYLHCWTTGTSVSGVSTWWHIRVNGTSWNGWIAHYYLDPSDSPTSGNKC